MEGGKGIPSFPVRLVDVRLKEVHAELVEIDEGAGERPSKVYTVGEQHPDLQRFFGTLGLEARLVLSDEEMLDLSVRVEGAFELTSASEQEEETVEAFLCFGRTCASRYTASPTECGWVSLLCH